MFFSHVTVSIFLCCHLFSDKERFSPLILYSLAAADGNKTGHGGDKQEGFLYPKAQMIVATSRVSSSNPP